jgi:hypothetical protein
MTRRHRHHHGQAATETMMMMMFLLLLIFGFIHISMFAATKYMVNLAAFAAGRTAMVKGDDRRATVEVLDNIRWTPAANATTEKGSLNYRGKGRDGIFVTFPVPFGLPVFNNIPAGGLKIKSFAPFVEQPDVPERGDNAE